MRTLLFYNGFLIASIITSMACSTTSGMEPSSEELKEIPEEVIAKDLDDFIYGQIQLEVTIHIDELTESTCTTVGRPVPISCLSSGGPITVELTYGEPEQRRTFGVALNCRLLSENVWCVSGVLQHHEEQPTEFDWMCQTIDQPVEFSEPFSNQNDHVSVAVTRVFTPPTQ